VLFVSSNGWDAAAAAAYGFRTLWVNRMGEPVDRLPGRPGHEAADLTGVPALLEPDLMDYVTAADGVRLAYDVTGAGPPLLCLPGLTRNMEDFDYRWWTASRIARRSSAWISAGAGPRTLPIPRPTRSGRRRRTC
jgi:hypothetical protein